MSKSEQVPTKKVNSLQARGKFTGLDILEQNRSHLEPRELVQFFDALDRDPFWYPYFYIQYYFGCRISEPALLLNKEDISFKNNLVVIRRLKKRDNPNGFSEYVYGLTDGIKKVIKFVREWNKIRGLSDNPFLFPSPRKPRSGKLAKERLGQLRRIDDFLAISRMSAHTAFKKAAKAASIPEKLRHAHVLRHTRATLMLAAGAPEDHVKFLLGHNSIETTRNYLGEAKSLRMRYQTSAELGFGLEGSGLEDFGIKTRREVSLSNLNDDRTKDFSIQRVGMLDISEDDLEPT